MKYKKKSVIVNALKWDGENHEELKKFCPQVIEWNPLTIRTISGYIRPSINDWIIYRDSDFGFLSSYQFEHTYEPISITDEFLSKIDVFYGNPKAEKMCYLKDVSALLNDYGKYCFNAARFCDVEQTTGTQMGYTFDDFDDLNSKNPK